VALSQSDHGESVRAILKRREGSLEEVNPEYLFDSEGAQSISRATHQAVQSSVVSIATALSPDFNKPQGQQMFQIVQTLRLA
jgi:hypothetical protein